MTNGSDKWVALLRGVNVGGANRVPMAQVRALAEGLGWGGVRSYIASGNLVFEADDDADGLARDLQAALLHAMGVDVVVRVLSAEQVNAALAACPFEDAGNLVHGVLCWDVPQVDGALRDSLIANDERMEVRDRIVWVHAPSGIGRSRLMARLDRVLAVPFTARNLNTWRKLADMVQA